MVALLEGKAAVVTGGSRGIGRAVSRALAAEGASVVVNGRDPGAAEVVAEEIRTAGGRAQAVAGSVVDVDFAGALIAACLDYFGALDVLVNCAGIPEPDGATVLDLDPGAWRQVLDVHLTGTFHTCRHAALHMAERGGGVIVNTSSHAARGLYGGSAYAAAKGGVESLTFAIAAELRDRGVRANAVCPGARTRLNDNAAYQRRIAELHARGVLDDAMRDASLTPPPPEQVAPLYTFLASDAARDVTGRVFTAVGGYVGLHAAASETLLAWRDAADGPWPVERLAETLRERLASGA